MPAESVIVRAATASDATAIQSIYAPVVLDSFASFEESAPGVLDMVSRMLARPRLPWLVAESGGRVVGYACASHHRRRPAYRWSADCSVYVDPEARGRGVGRALYEPLIAAVAELGYVSLFAGIALPNEASVGLHEAMGFEAIGVFRNAGYKGGAWHGVGWWQRTLCDPPQRPGEPRPWTPHP